MQAIPLSELPMEETGILMHMNLPDLYKKRLADLGFTAGTPITCCHIAPSGSPMAFYLKQTKFALRTNDCSAILIGLYD